MAEYEVSNLFTTLTKLSRKITIPSKRVPRYFNTTLMKEITMTTMMVMIIAQFINIMTSL